MSILGILLRFATSGVSGVVNYGLNALNKGLGKIDPAKKERIQAALNVAERVASTLVAFKWACPTRWQTAYMAVIDAVADVVAVLGDLIITEDELNRLTRKGVDAYAAWNTDDDETCKE